MWNLKCMIIPVKIGATGIVTRSLRKNLEAVPGKHLTDSLQKTAILGTSHIIWKVLQCETWFKRGTRQKRPVTRDIHIIIIIIIIIIKEHTQNLQHYENLPSHATVLICYPLKVNCMTEFCTLKKEMEQVVIH